MDKILIVILEILGVVVLFIIGIGIVTLSETWPEWSKKRGAIRCPKCGREMRLSANVFGGSAPPWSWYCGHCDYYVDIVPYKFDRKRKKARKQLEKAGFEFLMADRKGREHYRKKEYEASLDWTGSLRIIDLKLLEELYRKGGESDEKAES